MTTLPLFPLRTVLFPGIPINLHIFEDRYKQMIEACLKKGAPFGVVLIRKGREAMGPLATPHPIGCSAQIVQVQHLEEGRMNIRAVGQERFRILALDEHLPYLVGEVEQYPMVEEDPGLIQAADARLRPWVARYLQLLTSAGNTGLEGEELPGDPNALAYLAAYLLQIPMVQKQNLLASEYTSQLMDELRQHFRRELPLMRAILSGQSESARAPFSLN